MILAGAKRDAWGSNQLSDFEFHKHLPPSSDDTANTICSPALLRERLRALPSATYRPR